MIDKRLLGTWRSDTRKTMRDIRLSSTHKRENEKKLKTMFGKLTVRYTRSRVHTDFKGSRDCKPYRVVAKDSHSVAVVTNNGFDEDEIYHIHFEGKYYWVSIGRIREYFKKVD